MLAQDVGFEGSPEQHLEAAERPTNASSGVKGKAGINI
jgi:hypothetical protein